MIKNCCNFLRPARNYVSIFFLLACVILAHQPVFAESIFNTAKQFNKLPETRRNGSVSRGCGKISKDTKPLKILTVSARQTALSRTAQPMLYWYANRAIIAEAIEITLFNEHKLKDLGEHIRLKGELGAGLHMVDLAKHKIKLLPGEFYRWNVSIICKLSDRSGDTVASGTLMYSPMRGGSKELFKSCKDPVCKAKKLAGHGYWFDAFREISSLLVKQPKNREAQAIRTSLLRDVGLEAIAAALK